MTGPSLESVLTSRRVLVCVGAGGVGKTTLAAALAMRAAALGKSALVCTIDPARRLANALGLTSTSSPLDRANPTERCLTSP